jgi:hypothetical protein
MKIIILYDGNEESAKMSDMVSYCTENNVEVEIGDTGFYED